ncbi:putative 2-dehydropantoate 2-reductase [Sunxiuqinia sp. sy24]|uniref:putative 2-dehydropantoate 2-reductase n=1 Tax=Sunxiuqinia sp. sy24 TaxID=3461495 RepID=UPI004045717F
MRFKYAVIGTGGLGGYYGGKLAYAGADVHFLLRSDYQQVINNGLRVDSVKGDFHLHSVSAYSTIQEMPACDVVLVCLKTTNNHILAELLKPIVHDQTLVVLIQNGLGLEEDLDKAIPGLKVAGGLAFICSQKVGPGHVQHLDLGRLNLGMHSSEGEEVLKQVCQDFEQAGVPATFSSDLVFSRWQKLVWNIPFNGLTVVLNSSTDQLMANPEVRTLAHEMMLEVVHAARHCGFQLEEEFAAKMIATTAEMTPYAPSMKLDFDHQRPLEIDAIYSRPLQVAKEAGFEMKKTAMLEQQLRFLEARMQQEKQQ